MATAYIKNAPKTYLEAKTLLRNRQSKRLAGNTYLQVRDNQTIAVLLWQTDIVIFKKDGRIILNSGGWHTKLTKERMNCFAPKQVYSEKRQWHVDGSIFYDGIVLKNGEVTRPKIEDKRHDRLTKLIKKYVAKVRALKELPLPDGGDCWICKGMGDKRSCLEQHLKEGYVHGTLLVNALVAKGYNPAFTYEAGFYALPRAVRDYFKSGLSL